MGKRKARQRKRKRQTGVLTRKRRGTIGVAGGSTSVKDTPLRRLMTFDEGAPERDVVS